MGESLPIEYIQIFCQEGVETLVRWESICFDIESKFNPEQLESLFRAAHNLKGSARCVNLNELSNFIHKVEDLMSHLRAQKVRPSQECIDLLFSSQQVLYSWIHTLEKNINYVPQVESLEKSLLEMIKIVSQNSPIEMQKIDGKPVEGSKEVTFFDSSSPEAKNKTEIKTPSPEKKVDTKIEKKLEVKDDVSIKNEISWNIPAFEKTLSTEEERPYQSHVAYANILLKSSSVVLSGSDSWLISHLSVLANKYIEKSVVKGFSAEVLECFKGHPLLSAIDRVCLTKVLGHSNHLMCVDSANSFSQEGNLVTPGYSCFVIPDGSLFRLSRTILRTYRSLTDFISKNVANTIPIPRTAGLLNKMKFESGICMPFYRQQKIAGFMYLNSRQKNFFDYVNNEHFPIFCTLHMAASSVLVSCLPVSYLDSHSNQMCVANVFDENAMLSYLNDCKYFKEVSIRVGKKTSLRFMVIQDNINYICYMTINYLTEKLGCKYIEMQILKKSNSIIFFIAPAGELSPALPAHILKLKFNALQQEFDALGYRYRFVNNGIEIAFPFEVPLTDENGTLLRHSVFQNDN